MAESPAVIVKGGVEDIEFFGKSDINKHGNIGSEVPSWYLRQHREELENDISRTETSLERGEVREDMKPQILADLRKMKEKREQIESSEPKFTGKKQDILKNVSDDLGSKISDAMFTRSDMMKGIADAHEEARRMSEPCIKLHDDMYHVAKKCGCRISSDGRMSRTDAEKVWKICRRALGESSNTEVLRRNG